MKKPTKAELIAYIEEQEARHWEFLQTANKDLGINSEQANCERARWSVYYEILDFINSKRA